MSYTLAFLHCEVPLCPWTAIVNKASGHDEMSSHQEMSLIFRKARHNEPRQKGWACHSIMQL